MLLTYSDVQKYLKLLRRHRYSVRYFVTGEFGSLKGRAHWHVVLHFGPRLPLLKRGKVVQGADMNPVPPHKLGRIFMHERVDANGEPVVLDNGEPAMWWPHGWSHWTEGTSAANIRYNCKYVLKDIYDAERQGHLSMSKKPPLGALYFQGVAEQYVRQGLAPQDLSYSFPEVRRRRQDGVDEVVPFLLRDVSAELFLDHYVNAWARLRPGEAMPNSELVENWLEWRSTRVPDDPVRFAAFFERREVGVPAWMPRVAKPDREQLYSWMSAKAVKWDSERYCWVSPGRPWSDEHEWLWRLNKKGAYGWQRVRKATSEAA